jgi:2-keto-4-pentenoate hydratase
MNAAAVEQAAEVLFNARRTGVRIPELPRALKPASMEEVRAIIASVDQRIGEPVAGWKFHVKPGREMCAAPLYASRIFTSPARVPLAVAQTLAIEAEISFRLTRDLPQRDKAYDAEEVFSSTLACVAFEVVDSRYTDLKKMVAASLYEVYADHMANGAFVFGEFRSDWRNVDFSRTRVTMKQGEKVLADQVGGHPNVQPGDALPLFANWMRERAGLKAGCLIATGSFTSFRLMEADREVLGRFEGFGEVRALIASGGKHS